MAATSEFLEAVRRGDVAAVRAAVEADPELGRCRGDGGVSVVCLAVYFGQSEIAQVLAAGRTDLDVFEASTVGDAARVRALAEAEPGLVNAYSPDGFHPLGYACFFGRREVFQVLLAAGADVGAAARNATGVRPIHSAVAQADPDTALEMVSALLGAGASPNVRQQGDYTPLHEAARRGHLALVRELLRHGADPSVVSSDGATAGALARAGGHGDVVVELSEAGTS